MAKKATGGRAKLYTLTEVASKTGISMPTLQRYKKLYQERIPSTGEGRKQRYPTAALAVFNKIKQENVGKRGRPRKNPEAAAAPAAAKKKTAAASRKKSSSAPRASVKRSTRKAAKVASSTRKTRKTAAKKVVAKAPSAKAPSGNLLTLTEIAKRTKISYPTLSRYVKQHSAKLKSEGTGRARRFYEEAVSVFEELRSKSGRGRKPKAASKSKPAKKAASRRAPKPVAAPPAVDVELTKRVLALEKELKRLRRELSRPVRIKVLK